MDVIFFKLYACSFRAFKSISPPSARYLNRIKCSGVEGLMWKTTFPSHIKRIVTVLCILISTYLHSRQENRMQYSKPRGWQAFHELNMVFVPTLMRLTLQHFQQICSLYTKRIRRVSTDCKYFRCNAAVVVLRMCTDFPHLLARFRRHYEDIRLYLRFVLCV
jgi:hypothetical protein